jgi:hypothetical protein
MMQIAMFFKAHTEIVWLAFLSESHTANRVLVVIFIYTSRRIERHVYSCIQTKFNMRTRDSFLADFGWCQLSSQCLNLALYVYKRIHTTSFRTFICQCQSATNIDPDHFCVISFAPVHVWPPCQACSTDNTGRLMCVEF